MGKRKKTTTLSRFVYLMSVSLPWSDARWVGIAISGDRLIKIGIAKDTKERQQTVDRSNKKISVNEKDRYYCRNASRHERHLQNKFKADDRHFPIKNLDGGTEVFRLSRAEIREAQRYLRKESHKYHNRNRPIVMIIFITLMIMIYWVLKTAQDQQLYQP